MMLTAREHHTNCVDEYDTRPVDDHGRRVLRSKLTMKLAMTWAA